MLPTCVYASIGLLFAGKAFDAFHGVFKSHSTLNTTPTDLPTWQAIGLFVLVLLKYAVRLLGEGVGLCTGLQLDADAERFPIPKNSVTAPLHVTPGDLKLYRRAISKAEDLKQADSTNDGTNPAFILAPLTNPLLVHLLCKFTNPIRPLGAVNVRNRFEFLDPVACRNLMGCSDKLVARAIIGGPDSPGRKAKRGIEFDLTITVTLEQKPIFRQIFTVLQFFRHRIPVREDKQQHSEFPPETAQPAAEGIIQADFDLPSRWASLCKDYNPIHVSSIMAKFFGFPGKIAHGNAIVALAIEHLDFSQFSAEPYFLDVQFKKPVVVPMDLRYAFDSSNDTGKVAITIEGVAAEGRSGVHIAGLLQHMPASLNESLKAA